MTDRIIENGSVFEVSNPAIAHIRDIVRISVDANVDWSVAISIYAYNKNWRDVFSPEQLAQIDAEFMAYVKGRVFDDDGNVAGRFSGAGSKRDDD